jgi:hypothetical protein
MPEPGRDRLRGYAAIALVSCAVLIDEIAITRVLSVVLWYHFAFLAISRLLWSSPASPYLLR